MAYIIPRVEEALPALFVAGVGCVAGAAINNGVRLVKWWFGKSRIELLAEEVFKNHDQSDTGVSASAEMMASAGRMAPRIRRRVRGVAASSYALQAYLKFGQRKKSEANVIVTRKYISDLLSEEPDMRIRDKIEIMDTATFLSFIPSESSQLCGAFEKTEAFSKRMLGEFASL
jgi:hypothetical protein